MDRGAWQATVHRVAESGTTEVTEVTHNIKFIVSAKVIIMYFPMHI